MSIIMKEVDGITYQAECIVEDNLITVYGVRDSKSTQINGMKEEGLARTLLGHLIRESKAEEICSLFSRVRQSFNRHGQCTDNAHMESFFHSLKADLIRGNHFGCDQEIRRAVAGYVNQFYNTVRLHSSLEYMSSVEYEQCAV